MRTNFILASSLFLAAGLTGCVAPPQTGSENEALALTGVVISQIYGGGGNGTAVYASDYMVLFNSGTVSQSLAGNSVYYDSSGTGTAFAEQALTGTLAPGQYYLVSGVTGNSGAALTTSADVTSTFSILETKGTAAIGTSGLSATLTSVTAVDYVGYGAASSFKGAVASAMGSSAQSLVRGANGCTNNGDNATDFTAVQPAAEPPNSATTATPCTAVSVDMATASDMTQASTGDGSTTTTGNDGSTTTGNDGGPGPGPSSDAGDGVVGNRPQQNGAPTYAPGGNLSSDCSVVSFGGNAGRVGASALVATLLAGLAMRLRRRRA